MKSSVASVLIVEDDEAGRRLLSLACTAAGHSVIEAGSGRDALRLMREDGADLVMLDVNLPDMSGIEVCRRLRANSYAGVVVMLSARTDVIDAVVSLEVGADDYVRKPFEVRMLLARISAHLRRRAMVAHPEPPDRLEFPGLVINLFRRRAWRDRTEVDLTNTEFNLLAVLASRAGSVLTRHELLTSVWGCADVVESRTVDAHIYRLRQKLAAAGDDAYSYILSAPGLGYRFSDEPRLRAVAGVPMLAHAAA